MSDKQRIRILNATRADEDAILSRVPCVGECIAYKFNGREGHVRALSVLHFGSGHYAAQVTTEDIQ